MNTTDAVLAHARRHPAQPALLMGDAVVTHGEFAKMASRAANAMAALGLRPGDCVCLLMQDSPLAGAIIVGAMKAGFVPVPMNLRLGAGDYAWVARDCEAKLVVGDDTMLVNLVETRSAGSGGDGRGITVLGAGEFSRRMAAASDAHATVDLPPDAPSFRLYSSGTTGRPKGVIHSHASASLAGKLLREAIALPEGGTVLSTSKFFFAYGLENTLLAPLTFGATSILIHGWPDPEMLAALVARHAPHCVLTMPTLYRRMLKLPEAQLAPFRAVPHYYTGGERLPDQLALQWQAAVGRELNVGYGLTETLCNVSASFPGRPRPATNPGGCIGQPLAGVECQLRDREGRVVAKGEPGVLWIRHPSIALGYSDADKTAEAFVDGWFCTKDLVTQDEAGYLYHHGRMDELIKVAGQWVKPADVEEAAMLEPSVREAACVVVPDADGFERLALFVVPAAGHDAQGGSALDHARARCEQALPSHSRPKWIREIDELPRTVTGKVQRFRLREVMLETPPG
jgi:acyl-coenzyme A synthetase/AMP-(fatty) acid ligase